MLEPGQKIFEFEVVSLLGRGGFAAVYEAKDRMLDRRVAIKQLRLDKIKHQRNVKRFIQEARIAATLEHPNVLTVYGLRIENQRIYMILEYLSGGSLKDMVAKQGKLPPGDVIKLMNGICEGLAKLHKKDIVHRDIKADNILLTSDGRPKITDFGIAHVPQASGGMGLTQAGFQPSTVIFSSPEQFRGEPLDIRSDVYQVGELLYYLLTGKHYIDLDDLETKADTIGHNIKQEVKMYMLLEQAICKDPPPGMQDLRKEARGLATVVEKALAKHRKDRYEDVLDLAADLWASQFNQLPATSSRRT